MIGQESSAAKLQNTLAKFTAVHCFFPFWCRHYRLRHCILLQVYIVLGRQRNGHWSFPCITERIGLICASRGARDRNVDAGGGMSDALRDQYLNTLMGVQMNVFCILYRDM